MIPEDTIAEIRSRVDIVTLIQEYVPLKKAGVTFKGLCPFHNEKSASFNVHPKRRFFHCFGCQASGDVFAFLMRIDGSSFPEVARVLAERTGVEIPNSDPKEEAEHRRKKKLTDRLFALTDAAAGFFLQSLKDAPHSELAREAILGRDITDETASRFRLGYAPSGWSGLVDFLSEGGWPLADAEKLGLIVPRRGSGYYDRFRHRLMFPVSDVHGRIVAFSGRTLPSVDPNDADKESAKYVNSPETPIYTKGSVLFGLHEARVPARRVSTMVVCEGNFDLLAISQAEVEHVVAPLGTAFTKEHAKLLRRHVEKVILLFDADNAGRKATRSAFPLLQEQGIATQVATLPAGYDPDSFIRDKGPEALQQRIQSAKPIVDHLIDEARRDSVGDARATADAIEQLGPILAAIDNPVERRLSVERVAQKFGITDLQVVKQQLRRGLSASRSPRRRRQGAVQAPAPTPRRPAKIEFDPMEEGVVAAMLEHPQLFAKSDQLSLVIKEESLLDVIRVCRKMAEVDGVLDGATLLAALAGNPASSWVEKKLVESPREVASAEHAVAVGYSSLVKKDLIRRAKRLGAECTEAFERGDEEFALSLSRQRTALQQLANRIRGAAPLSEELQEAYQALCLPVQRSSESSIQ